MVLQAQTQLALRQSTSEASQNEMAALDSVLVGYRQLQDLRLAIVALSNRVIWWARKVEGSLDRQ
ncbi:hypothetical protein LBMAG41_30170 [Cyanobium sp.]|jgi:hypothetical protein|nr:hypothetical protein LBMAG41_30170 [Cyanobium sp.]